jgi:hypothetical protein
MSRESERKNSVDDVQILSRSVDFDFRPRFSSPHRSLPLDLPAREEMNGMPTIVVLQ